MEEFQDEADPLKALQQKVSIRQIGGSQLYKVNSVSKSPQDAAAIANAVVAEYLSIQSDEGFRRTQRVIDLLEEERSRRSLEVERLRERVLVLAKEVTGKDPFGQGVVTDVAQIDGADELSLPKLDRSRMSSKKYSKRSFRPCAMRRRSLPITPNLPDCLT